MSTFAPNDDCLTLLITVQFGFPMILRASSKAGMEQNEEKKIIEILLPLCHIAVEWN